MCAKRILIFLQVFLLFSYAAGALRSQELPQPGKTHVSSPNSGLSSNSSSKDLMTWEKLSESFQEALTAQSEQLRQALKETETSKANSERLTSLLGESLKANSSLRNYNAQIAERMQERDEDLASAHDRINVLEKRCLKAVIVIIVMGGLIIGAAALRFMKIIPI